MLIRLLCIFCLISQVSCAFGQLSDDFTDGDFNANPSWTGDASLFQINGSNQLQNNGPAQSDTAYLSTANNVVFSDTITWEFWMDLAFSPSNNNLVRVYLVADQTNLNNPLNGYFLRIGESGSTDALKLYRQTGTSTSIIMTGSANTYGTSPTLRVRVKRDPTGLWTVWADPTGGTTFVVEGTANDATHSSTTSFGVWCKYTSSNSSNFYFDDFVLNGTTFVDTVPPVVQSATPVSTTELDLQFSEALDPATAQNTANYLVDLGVGNPSSATLDSSDPSLVHLVFGTAFGNGITQQVSVANVEDLFSNTMSAANLNFFWFVSPPAAFQEVIINEVFADPNPPVALPTEEYIELFNASSTTFDLSNWEYSDASSTVTLGSHLLNPGDYLILCAVADTGLFTTYGTVVGLPSWPTLNNSSDSLSLRDNNGSIVDQVNYELSWYRDASKESGGFSFERINPFQNCGGSTNWLGSSNIDGGTPGSINAVFDTLPDTVAPIITEVTVVSNLQVEVVFNEGMDSSSLANASYTLDQGGTVSTAIPIGPDFSSVTLNMATALNSDLLYTLSISGANDCGGNTLSPNTISFGIGSAPLPYEVVINELFPNPDPAVTSLPDGEFIELINTTNKLIRLDGYELADPTGIGTLGNALLFPFDRLILCPTSDTALWTGFGSVVPVSNFPSLNNSSDQIELREPGTGTVIDGLTYTDQWYLDAQKSAGGWTIERINPGNICGGSRNWRASIDAQGGTPGAVNSVFNPNFGLDLVGIEAVLVLATNRIVLRFDQNMSFFTLPNGNYQISPSLAIDSILPLADDPAAVELVLSSNLFPGTSYQLTVSNVFDCVGGPLGPDSSVTFALASPQDIVINEVLFNPLGSGTDFVELYNRSENDVNLSGWGMASYNSEGERSINVFSDTTLILKTGEFLLLNEDNQNVLAEYPRSILSTFQETNLPTYSNASGSVILVDNLTLTIDSFSYTEDFHFALLQDPQGVSLERLEYGRNTNDATNWHSAAESEGFATPGYENSQFDEGSIASNTVTLEPEAFSPNNDGQDDVLNIRYQLEASGYVANISIYDARGRLVRRLTENELLAREGTISWDGTTDEREKALTGIHVVLIEVFDLDGNLEVFKKPCVVATRF